MIDSATAQTVVIEVDPSTFIFWSQTVLRGGLGEIRVRPRITGGCCSEEIYGTWRVIEPRHL
jgi:hypothetical protein